MPLYEYECTACGQRVEMFKRLADREQADPCEQCGQPTKRVVSGFAVVGGKGASTGSFGADAGGRGCLPSG